MSRSKFSKEERINIVNRYQNGESGAMLGNELNIDAGTVLKWSNGIFLGYIKM